MYRMLLSVLTFVLYRLNLCNGINTLFVILLSTCVYWLKLSHVAVLSLVVAPYLNQLVHLVNRSALISHHFWEYRRLVTADY